MISLRSLYTIFLDDEARDNYIFDADDRQSDLVPGTAACSTAVNPRPPPPAMPMSVSAIRR